MALGQRPRLHSASVQSVVPDTHFEQRGHSGLGQWVGQFFGSVKEAAV